jgi:hypothetical protein
VTQGPVPDEPLLEVVREIERHIAVTGWDQPTRLFALVDTGLLLAREPSLADQLASSDDLATVPWTPVEQERLPPHTDPTQLLAGIGWPDDVVGAALGLEMLLLPDDAVVPDDPVAAQQAAAAHPRRREVRIVAAYLRDGTHSSVVRWRDHDHDEEVLQAPRLVGTLIDSLQRTFDAPR